jgi:hypothetical protein
MINRLFESHIVFQILLFMSPFELSQIIGINRENTKMIHKFARARFINFIKEHELVLECDNFVYYFERHKLDFVNFLWCLAHCNGNFRIGTIHLSDRFIIDNILKCIRFCNGVFPMKYIFCSIQKIVITSNEILIRPNWRQKVIKNLISINCGQIGINGDILLIYLKFIIERCCFFIDRAILENEIEMFITFTSRYEQIKEKKTRALDCKNVLVHLRQKISDFTHCTDAD